MKYMLLIYGSEEREMEPGELDAIMDEYWAFDDGLRERGQLIAGEALQPTATATTVRVRNGSVQTADGPFAETKEQLGGFYVLEAQDLDEAIALGGEDPRRAHRLGRDSRVDGVRTTRGVTVRGARERASTMRYLLLVYADERLLPQFMTAEVHGESEALARELNATGRLELTGGLAPTSSATTVRVRDGRVLLTDAPFEETGERLGSFSLAVFASLEDAVAAAARMPIAAIGSIEVRPVREMRPAEA